jgi:hypothetical protein
MHGLVSDHVKGKIVRGKIVKGKKVWAKWMEIEMIC